MMKNNHNHGNAPGTEAKRVPVHFQLADPKAITVCIAETFNHWHPEAKTLHSSGADNWWKEMFLAPDTNEYCLVVNGKWMTDPHARESVPNPSWKKFNFESGQLTGSCASGRRRKYTAEKRPF